MAPSQYALQALAPALPTALALSTAPALPTAPAAPSPDSAWRMFCFLLTFLIKPVLYHLCRLALQIQGWMLASFPAFAVVWQIAVTCGTALAYRGDTQAYVRDCILTKVHLWEDLLTSNSAVLKTVPKFTARSMLLDCVRIVLRRLGYWQRYAKKPEGGDAKVGPARTFSFWVWLALVLLSDKLTARYAYIDTNGASPWCSVNDAQWDTDHTVYLGMIWVKLYFLVPWWIVAPPYMKFWLYTPVIEAATAAAPNVDAAAPGVDAAAPDRNHALSTLSDPPSTS
ncbi:hypothetical protein EIP91_004254 [Steccherinum ochraceum]|uniref:Uncharacterized protein n=1 Tax=Steccherinum ochraceum TaxID=92696 RepID=A0A4V2MW03_9APHY|nr:hypothetical protein EIP91_004254 [Steccherinum ochraceum]